MSRIGSSRASDYLTLKDLPSSDDTCFFLKRDGDNRIIMSHHVDDFVNTGPNDEYILQLIGEYADRAPICDPIKNPPVFLGLELERNFDKRIILVRVSKKIEEMCSKHLTTSGRTRNVPMPTSYYIVRDEDLDQLSETKRRFLEPAEITTYMSIVGGFIWIQGIRHDIVFTVLYLSWFLKKPRQHHMECALYCLGYLEGTKDLPLVLGGCEDLAVHIMGDTSLGTGPKGRSVMAMLGRLGFKAGAVSSKSQAQDTVKLSSMHAELETTSRMFKWASRLDNIMKELEIPTVGIPTIWNDNEAGIAFIKNEHVPKSIRHMELKEWYIKEQYKMHKANVRHLGGTVLTADKQTKLGCVSDHRKFTADIMGHGLLGSDYNYWSDIVSSEISNQMLP
jgi:hypothetical protein